MQVDKQDQHDDVARKEDRNKGSKDTQDNTQNKAMV
jgi:hypothetical protein